MVDSISKTKNIIQEKMHLMSLKITKFIKF